MYFLGSKAESDKGLGTALVYSCTALAAHTGLHAPKEANHAECCDSVTGYMISSQLIVFSFFFRFPSINHQDGP